MYSLLTSRSSNRVLVRASSIVLALALLIGIFPLSSFADTTTATSTPMTTSPGSSTYKVMIMTHLCNSSIKDWNDFENMESGRNPVENIARDVLACPTTGLSTSVPVAGSIASPRSNYDFSVTSDAQTQTLSTNGMFEPVKICESDVNLDLDGNGTIATSTCLDISDYMIPVNTSSASSTILRVMETQSPAGYHFGALRFTPVAIDGNNDSEDIAYVNPIHGEIDLNMVPDKDGMIMLHVYQFQNGTSTSTGDMGSGNTGMNMGSTTNPSNPNNGMMTGMISPQNPSVRLGTSVNFTGSGFGHEESVTVMLNGNTVTTAHADGGGNFSTGSLSLPWTMGTYTYTFMGQSSGISGTDSISVTN